MNFLNKLERKFGRYAVPDLIRYIMIVWIGSTVLFNISTSMRAVYYYFLSLDIGMVLQGQIWRLVTFILCPYPIQGPTDIIFFGFQVYIYLMIGRSLENAWGSFRFNMFFLSGILFNILGAVFLFIGHGGGYYVGLEYLFQSMFFAFAVLYPNIQFLLFYIIPVKVKWLAVLDAVLLGWSVFTYLKSGHYYIAISIIMAFANFLIFYFATRNYRRISPREQRRKAAYKRQVHQATAGPRHRCAVCGRTELDDPNLEFRYCSKCNGSYEYCMKCLYTHKHIK